MPPSNPPQSATSPSKPPAMPLWLKVLFFLGVALCGFLVAMMFAPSSRGYGGPGGIGTGLLYFIGIILLGGFLIWSYFTWLIYRSLHDRTRAQRFGLTLLFFVLPLILFGAEMSIDWLKEIPGS